MDRAYVRARPSSPAEPRERQAAGQQTRGEGRLRDLDGADVTDRAAVLVAVPRSPEAALIEGRAGPVVSAVDDRTSGEG